MVRVGCLVCFLAAVFGLWSVTTMGVEVANFWAIEMNGGVSTARKFADLNGFTFVKHVFKDVYLFKTGQGLKISDQIEASLSSNSQVTWYRRQVPRKRHLKSMLNFNDPEWDKQSYLYTGNVNMNVLPAWESACAGEGVTVGVVDNGVIVSHPDLRNRMAMNLSYDFLRDRPDPTPPGLGNDHGTRCAGVIAATANNSFCGVGIAFRAKIAGLRLLSDVISELLDADEAAALSFKAQEIAIYSNSWGPADFQYLLDGPEPLLQSVLREGVATGRGGKGSIYVFSGGNGGGYGDSCAYDGYVNSIYTIGINAIWPTGAAAIFNEPCTAIMATAYGNDFFDKNTSFVVPSQRNGCSTDFTGTSPTTAMAAGAIALALEANPSLTWRDVQHLIARTAKTEGLCGSEWITNNAGFKVSNLCGFGLMDAGSMVIRARSWTKVPDQVICQGLMSVEMRTIPANGALETTVNVNSSACAPEIHYLEHVLVHVTLTFPHRGYLIIEVTSPSGTTSTVAPGRVRDVEPDLDWTFLTLHHWGEDPLGVWTLRVNNTHPDRTLTGSLSSWSLALYGTSTQPLNNETTSSSPPSHTPYNCVTISDDTDDLARNINKSNETLIIVTSVLGTIIFATLLIAIGIRLAIKKNPDLIFLCRKNTQEENPCPRDIPL